MVNYHIQKTQRGKFIVRDQADRQLARRDTEAEAQTWLDDRIASDVAESKRLAAIHQEQQKFDGAVPDLNRLQIRWQNWRNWFYNELVHAERNAAQFGRAQDMKFDEHHASPSFQKQQRYLTEELTDVSNARELYDEKIVPLDTLLKNARQAHDTDDLAVTLDAAEPLIESMNGFFMGVARPEEYKRPVGRPPAAGSGRQIRISATVPPDYKTWLERRGDISEQIRSLIERAMEESR